MKIYLDSCSLQRPLDKRDQTRIAMEAEAILAILSLCESGEWELISSEALTFEISRTPSLSRKEYGLRELALAKTFVEVNDATESRAKEFVAKGIKPLDALHLALAEQSSAGYFCSCDDRFLKKAKALHNLKTRVVTPLELAQEIDQ